MASLSTAGAAANICQSTRILHSTLFLKKKNYLLCLKGTVSQDFRLLLFFCLKDSTWVPYEQAKTVSRTF